MSDGVSSVQGLKTRKLDSPISEIGQSSFSWTDKIALRKLNPFKEIQEVYRLETTDRRG
jgi:hypothetical protein